MLSGLIQLYIMSAAISYLGMLYKYKFSSRDKGGNITKRDWELVFVPVLNTAMMFGTVVIIIFDIFGKIADRYGL